MDKTDFYVDGSVAISGNGSSPASAFKTIGEGLNAWAAEFLEYTDMGMDPNPLNLHVRGVDSAGREIVYSTRHGASDAIASVPQPQMGLGERMNGTSAILGYAVTPGDLGAPIVLDCHSEIGYGWLGTLDHMTLMIARTVVRNSDLSAYRFLGAASLIGKDWACENCAGGIYSETYNSILDGGRLVNSGGVKLRRCSYVLVLRPNPMASSSGTHIEAEAYQCAALGCRGTAPGIGGGSGNSNSVRNCVATSADGLGFAGISGWDGFGNISTGFVRPLYLMGIASGNVYTPGTQAAYWASGWGNHEVPALVIDPLGCGDARVVSPSLKQNGVPIGYSEAPPGRGEVGAAQTVVNMGARR